MYITIQMALDIAIEAIQKLPDTYENRQAITRLTNLKNTKVTVTWTKEEVFKHLNKWREQHRRNPTITDLVEPDMPKATTIKKLFDMKASAFLNVYYTSEKKKKSASRYSLNKQSDWIDIFKREFERIRPKSGREYEAKRGKGKPTWGTIARNLNLARWLDLVKLCGVDMSSLHSVKTADTVVVTNSENRKK